MMISIDTSELKKVKLRIDDKRKTRRVVYELYADSALPKIAKFIRRSRPKVIGVVVEAGAWSATRTGVAIANALAYGMNIPLAPLTKAQFDAEVDIPAGAHKLAIVVYDAPPNITQKKK